MSVGDKIEIYRRGEGWAVILSCSHADLDITESVCQIYNAWLAGADHGYTADETCCEMKGSNLHLPNWVGDNWIVDLRKIFHLPVQELIKGVDIE